MILQTSGSCHFFMYIRVPVLGYGSGSHIGMLVHHPEGNILNRVVGVGIWVNYTSPNRKFGSHTDNSASLQKNRMYTIF